jgi:hypothetical protein
VRVAFDLDQTLIPYGEEFPVEPSVPSPLLRPFFRESLRAGTRVLLRDLTARGCDIYLYTTSGRDPLYLRLWFRLLGIRLGGVVNCHRHERVVRAPGRSYPACSKYPPAFGIDLLIDDSDGVQEEGNRHGFAVLIVHPSDADWAERIRSAVIGKEDRGSDSPLL